MKSISTSKLTTIIADLLDLAPEDLSPERSFHEQGEYDSLKVVLLMAALEEDFDLSVPPTEAWELNSVQDILEFAKKTGAEIQN